VTTLERDQIAAVQEAVDAAELAAYVNVRGYRNLLAIWIMVLVAFLIAFPVAVRFLEPGFVALSGQTTPTTVAGPAQATTSTATTTTTGATTSTVTTTTTAAVGRSNVPASVPPTTPSATKVVATLEVWGAVGGLVGVLVALRRIGGVRGPYALPIVQTALKVPAGAVIALFGLLILQSSLLPGLALVDDKALAAYAALFGFAQESVTRLVDRQAGQLLGRARSPNDPAATAGTAP
jgi:hypothetical protein